MKGIWALLLPLLICGCVSAPKYTDAFSGLRSDSSTLIKADQEVAISDPVGIIFSDNVEAYLKYSKEGEEILHSFGPLTNTVAAADIDPTFVAGRVLTMLKERYPNINHVPDFNEALNASLQNVFLLDTRVNIGSMSGSETSVDLAVYVFDAAMDPISKISGHGSGTIPYPAFDTKVQEATEQALAELKMKLNKYIN